MTRIARIVLYTILFALAFSTWSEPVTAAAEAPAARLITDPTEVWSAWSAEAELHIYPQSLEPIGVEVQSAGLSVHDGERLAFRDLNLGSISFHAPDGNFEGFIDGRLVLAADLSFEHAGRRLEVRQLIVEPAGKGLLALNLRDAAGRLLFTASHIHVYTAPAQGRLVMERMDVKLGEDLAAALGLEDWTGRFVGELILAAELNIPAGARTSVQGDSCSARPKWPTEGFQADVSLIAMGSVQDRGTVFAGGKVFEILTPSARLKNDPDLDAADVPWFQKFTGTFPPYGTDQHPYLVWNLYRIADGRLEQIGASGVKHAFLTINSNCTVNCGAGGVAGGNGHILWPGCEDVYGVGNNDSACDLGPRHEVNPRTGIFVSTGSFFDPGGTGSNTNCSSAPGENRMMVLREDLETPGASYWFESWYVIRDDVNIYNTMGYHPLTPVNTSGNNWSYQLGAFVQGRAIDQWVAPGTAPDGSAAHQSMASDEDGHLHVLARAEPVDGGRWRYSYVVMNYDVDHGVAGFRVASANPILEQFHFHDGDQNPANDWTISQAGAWVTFAGSESSLQPWGRAYSFGFEAETGPVLGPVEVTLGPGAERETVEFTMPVPQQGELIFKDCFSLQACN